MSRESHSRLGRYLDAIALDFPHRMGADAARDYCTGLLLPANRKNIELMAARLAPAQVSAKHQSMHHFIAKMEWDDDTVLTRVCGLVLPALQRRLPVSSWIIDSIAVPKQGRHSVGIAHQCGSEGRLHNCQVAVTLSIANQYGSLPVASQLFLPQEWADDLGRRCSAGVPDHVSFQSRPSIALNQIVQIVRAGLPAGVLVADEEYGRCAALRDGLHGLGVLFILAVPPSTMASASADCTSAVRLDTLALALADRAWRRLGWPGGEKPSLSRFAACLVWTSGPDRHERPLWLLVEWPVRATQPERFWLSNLPPDATPMALVRAAKSRSRTINDRKLRTETGLGHFEGRGWRGFHHHATMSIAAYGFMVAERCGIRTSERFHGDQIVVPHRPFGFRPRN